MLKPPRRVQRFRKNWSVWEDSQAMLKFHQCWFCALELNMQNVNHKTSFNFCLLFHWWEKEINEEIETPSDNDKCNKTRNVNLSGSSDVTRFTNSIDMQTFSFDFMQSYQKYRIQWICFPCFFKKNFDIKLLLRMTAGVLQSRNLSQSKYSLSQSVLKSLPESRFIIVNYL